MNINLSNEEISSFTKLGFKKYMKTACREYSFSNLKKQKEKLSKGSELSYNELKIQNLDNVKQIFLTSTKGSREEPHFLIIAKIDRIAKINRKSKMAILWYYILF